MSTRFPRLLHEALLVSAEQSPDKLALISEGWRYTYRELVDAVTRLASAWRERGLERGDRVAIYLDNGWHAAVAIFAALAADGVFLVVNPQTKADKLAYILNDCEARFFVTDAHLSGTVSQVVADATALTHVTMSGAPIEPMAGGPPVEAFDDVVASGRSDSVRARAIPVDLAALIYTSGSTGRPKGVMMTHQAMLFTTGSLSEYLRLDDTHRILNVLPFAFDYGLYQLLMAVRVGATLIAERSFAYPAQALQVIDREQATVFPGVPTVFATLLGMHRRRPLRFESVLRVTNTAAALPPNFLPGLAEIFPNALIYKMYGLTECKRVSYLEPEELHLHPDSVGKAIPGTEVFLLSDDGQPVPAGQVGILHVRGPHVMAGYWKQPELTQHMLRPDRWGGQQVLCTHDHFRMDADGYLYFVGRTDDIIKTRAEKVSPIEVENALHGMPGIREAAVVGIPDETLGQAIRAFVVCDPGVTLTEKDVKRYCLSQLENFMVPKVVTFTDALPKTDSGKIKKTGLADLPIT